MLTRVVCREIENKVVLPKRAVPNPSPRLFKDGDCGACVLAGLFDMKVDHVYASRRDGKVSPFSYQCMRDFLFDRQSLSKIDRFILEIPHWDYPQSLMPFGNVSWLNSTAWFNYVRMGIDAGYYGIAFVRYDKKGTTHPIISDHIVLVCGVRDRCVTIPELKGASVINHEILISCSAKNTDNEEWVVASDFLRDRGGYNIILVRPC